MIIVTLQTLHLRKILEWLVFQRLPVAQPENSLATLPSLSVGWQISLFVRTIYAVVADPHKALPWAFANFVTNPIGQKIIFKAGLLPYRGEINIREVEVKTQ